MKKTITLVLSLILMLSFAFAVNAEEGKSTITVTRAEASDDFDYGFEAEYSVKCAEGDLDGDAWIGIYSVDLVAKVLADEDVFSGHSFGSWCSVSLDGEHESALAAGEYKVNHTDGEWGDFVINEGASNPAIWGGELEIGTEYRAVLFKCDTDGYEIVAVSDVFTFTEPGVEPVTDPATEAATEPEEDPAPATFDAAASVAVAAVAAMGIVLVSSKKRH